jgi:uncharacterized protein (TIGR03083 family)
LRIETSLGDVAVPLVRQRARLTNLLETLDKEQWASPTRCDGWNVQDVVAHLAGANDFWAISVTSALSGTRTQFLAEFDPVATPAQMVDAVRSRTISETLDRFRASNEALANAVTDLDENSWSTLAEAPPGHISVRALALHAMWDAWIHERDIALPLGLDTAIEPDEIAGSLQYATAIGPALLAGTGSNRVALLGVEATNPDVAFVVEIGTSVVVRDGSGRPTSAVLSGDAVELLEGVSYRVPLPRAFPDSDRWMMAGLAAAFDTVV